MLRTIPAALAAVLALAGCTRWVVDSVGYTRSGHSGQYWVGCVVPGDPEAFRVVDVTPEQADTLDAGDPCPLPW